MSVSRYEQKADLAPIFLAPWQEELSFTVSGAFGSTMVRLQPMQENPWLRFDLAVSAEARGFHELFADALKSAAEAFRALVLPDRDEDELPETLDLQPIRSWHATARVRYREQAQFHFIDAEDELEALD